MQSAGVEFEMLGMSFEEGAGLIRDLAIGLKTGIKIPPEVLKTGKELTAVLGLTGDEAGSLIVQFQKSGLSVKELNDSFKVGAAEAKKYGLPVNDVLRDIGQAPNLLARFGTKNAQVFAKAAAKAKSYGLSIKEIDAAFGEQLDTFEGSANAASKLNAVFGTSVNSLELMLETNPMKRMEMIRSSLENQGKSWEKLSVFEQNVITSSLGVEKSQAALILSSAKERKGLEEKARAKKNQINIDEKWNAGMGSIKKTLLAWGPLLDQLMRSASNFIVKLFGGKDAGTTVMKTADVAANAIKTITGAIDEATLKITVLREGLARFFSPTNNADKLLELIRKPVKEAEDLLAIKKLTREEDTLYIAQLAMINKGENKDLLARARSTADNAAPGIDKFNDLSGRREI